MSLHDDIKNSISTILNATWNVRDGQVVPKTEDVVLANGAVKLDATFLYADLANSTRLAKDFDHRVAAKIVRAFLATATRLIRSQGGEVRSFDGDRVMGVFVGDSKNTAAVKCALQINYAVRELLRPAAEAKYSSLKTKGFVITHCCGIHTGETLVVRAGIRDNNDLVFIGTPPNFAATLSEQRTSAKTYITDQIYTHMHKTVKFGGDPEQNMWKGTKVTLGGEAWACYTSSWHWSL